MSKLSIENSHLMAWHIVNDSSFWSVNWLPSLAGGFSLKISSCIPSATCFLKVSLKDSIRNSGTEKSAILSPPVSEDRYSLCSTWVVWSFWRDGTTDQQTEVESRLSPVAHQPCDYPRIVVAPTWTHNLEPKLTTIKQLSQRWVVKHWFSLRERKRRDDVRLTSISIILLLWLL